MISQTFKQVLKQTFIYKVMILGLSLGLSLSAIASDFTDT